MSRRPVKLAAAPASANLDNLERALDGVQRLRKMGILPVRIAVGEVSFELAYLAPPAGGRPRGAVAAGPLSAAEEYLGAAGAKALEDSARAPRGGAVDEDEDEPAVRG